MKTLNSNPSPAVALSRRGFIFNTVGATLSVTAIGMLSGCSTMARAGDGQSDQVQADIRILGTALMAEREAVAAYQLGSESGLLQAAVLKVAVSFQDHHKAHADVLADTIRKLGGEVAEPPKSFNFPTEGLRAQRDVLEFAAGLERGAVSAYVGAIPLFGERDLSKAAASILADEAMHWAVLRQALGLDPVPGAFFS